MAGKFRTWAPILLVALLSGGAFGQKQLPEFRSRFAHETDPVRRAKMMPQLEKAEFEALSKSVDEGKPGEALAILQEYRDQAESCEKDMDARGVSAEKHPNGFKQLQFALRESLRHIDTLLVGLSADQQDPFLKVRKDLAQLNHHLIRELFPEGPDDDNASPN